MCEEVFSFLIAVIFQCFNNRFLISLLELAVGVSVGAENKVT